MKRISMMSVLTVVFFFFVASMTLPLFADAKGRKSYSDVPIQSAMRNPVVTGLIESVSNDSIVVLGKRYMIAGVPLIQSPGVPVSQEELKIGTKVAIGFKNGVVISIQVYKNLPE